VPCGVNVEAREGIRRLSRGVCNFCLVEQSGKVTLVDAGAPGLNEDTEQAFASLDALRGISADLLLPGHGEPWTGGVAEAVTRAKAAGRS